MLSKRRLLIFVSHADSSTLRPNHYTESYSPEDGLSNHAISSDWYPVCLEWEPIEKLTNLGPGRILGGWILANRPVQSGSPLSSLRTTCHILGLSGREQFSPSLVPIVFVSRTTTSRADNQVAILARWWSLSDSAPLIYWARMLSIETPGGSNVIRSQCQRSTIAHCVILTVTAVYKIPNGHQIRDKVTSRNIYRK